MSNDAAYWLGFLYTDGSIQEDKGIIQLKINDYDSLEQFKEFIEYEGPIQTVIEHTNNKTFVSYQISFIDRIMVDKLIRLGCIPRKTYILEFPTKEQLDPKYYGSFIRGIFDGDGSVFMAGNKLVMEITGTEQFLTGLRKALAECGVVYGTKSYIYKSHAKNSTIKRLALGRFEFVDCFYQLIYENDCNFYLKRKKEKYSSLLEMRRIKLGE